MRSMARLAKQSFHVVAASQLVVACAFRSLTYASRLHTRRRSAAGSGASTCNAASLLDVFVEATFVQGLSIGCHTLSSATHHATRRLTAKTPSQLDVRGCAALCLSLSSGIMVSGILTASHGRTPHLQLVTGCRAWSRRALVMHSAPSHKAKALKWCGATLHEPGWSVEHTRHARHTRPPRKTVLFTTQQASAVSCCSALAGLTSTRLTLGHETRSSGRCSGSAAASRSMRGRPGLGLLCVLHAFPRACCVIGTTALLCAMPLKAALFST